MSIPKILHFTWKTDDVPGKMGEYLEIWRKLHTNWDVRLWTDATMRVFVSENYPDFLATYDNYPHPIQRADSFRYLVLLALGGVYADLDVEPFRNIDVLVDGLTCFAGVEPDEHMGADRYHSGTPYLVSNAFMGAVPGHPYFGQLVDLLPVVASNPDIFLSTGPALTTGGAARMARTDKPTLVPPCLWSPLCDGGVPCQTDDKIDAVLSPDFDLIWLDRKAVVSHYWLTSWVPWDKRHKWLAKPLHALHDMKWALREKRFPELAAFDPKDALWPFSDQTVKSLDVAPSVALCIGLNDGEKLSQALANTLGGLNYPRDKIRVYLAVPVSQERNIVADAMVLLGDAGFSTVDSVFVVSSEVHDKTWTTRSKTMQRSACMRNELVQAVGKNADWLLFVDQNVTHIPPTALVDALESGYPVVGLAALNVDGDEVDDSVYRYHWGGGIRVSYKIRGEDGIADNLRGQRDQLSRHKAFRMVPLDGVGTGFVLAARTVFDSGVKFAEEPYKMHLDGEGFALAARANGFEVAGLTELSVKLG